MTGTTRAGRSGRCFYVSPRGDDRWSGTVPAPSGTAGRGADGPFATLARARDAIRVLRAQGGVDGPIDVLVLGGTYRFSEPLVLDARDSGTPEHPVTYAAFPGERPVLSGGRALTGWEPYRGTIVQCAVPSGTVFRQLFHDDRRQIRARWPARDPAEPRYGGWAFIEEVIPKRAGEPYPRTFRCGPERPTRRWDRPQQAEVFIHPWLCWLNDIIPIESVDESGTITLTRCAHHGKHELTVGNRFIVENVLEELRGPGQWCLDAEAGTVYFWPPGGSVGEGTVGEGTVVAPVTDRIIELRGTDGDPVHDIAITGFTLAHTRSPFPDHQHAETFHSPGLRGGTVHLEHAERCRIERNTFRSVGADGVHLEGYNAHNTIAANEFAYPGACGVSVASNSKQNTVTWMDREVVAERTREYPHFIGNAIRNNHIHHNGVIKKRCGAIQVFAMNSVDNVIAHNLIHDTSDKAVMMKDGFGRITVEYNRMERLGLECADTAAVMSESWFVLDDDPDLSKGLVIRNNLIRDVIGCAAYGTPMKRDYVRGTRAGGRIWTPYFNWGIYSDNTGMSIVVYGNIVAGTVLGGVSLPVGNPTNIVIENNVFVDALASQADLQIGGGWTKGEGASGNRFVRNVIHYTTRDAALLNTTEQTRTAFAECDYNLYHPAEGQTPVVNGVPGGSFDAWRELGFDRHSVFADPLFVDYANGDYRLRPESPAFALGFRPIDVDHIGLESPGAVGAAADAAAVRAQGGGRA